MWEISTGECKNILRGHEHVVECVRFLPSASGKYLQELIGGGSANNNAVYVASGSRDKTIKIWDIFSGQCVATLSGHDNWVRDLSFSSSGKYLFSVSDDKSLRIWDLSLGRCAKTLADAHSHFVTCIASMGNLVATGSVDQSVKIWSCR